MRNFFLLKHFDRSSLEDGNASNRPNEARKVLGLVKKDR